MEPLGMVPWTGPNQPSTRRRLIVAACSLILLDLPSRRDIAGGTFCGGRWILVVCAIPEFSINVHDLQVGESGWVGSFLLRVWR